jgi:hypothetical protein
MQTGVNHVGHFYFTQLVGPYCNCPLATCYTYDVYVYFLWGGIPVRNAGVRNAGPPVPLLLPRALPIPLPRQPLDSVNEAAHSRRGSLTRQPRDGRQAQRREAPV